jgi:plasmid stability protein
MARMTIRDLSDRLKRRLRIQGAKNSPTMEEQARAILTAALSGDADSARSLCKRIRARIVPLGGVKLTPEPPDPIRPTMVE